MKKNKRLNKLVEKCVGDCCTEGRINSKKTLDVVRGLKSLPLEEAVYAISEFLKQLKKQKDKHSLIVESAIPLSKPNLDAIAKKFAKEYRVSEVKNITNPSLYGGLKIKIGDNIYEDSIQSRIKQVGGMIHG